jgi:multidrug resistance efflux pump
MIPSKPLAKLLTSVALLAGLLMPGLSQAKLLLTGEIAAKNSEIFYAPRVTGWQIQMEWMMPEGQVAKPGDLVVLFERSSIDADIEMKKSDVLKKKDQLTLAKNKGEEDVMTADFAMQKAQLEYEKAKIDAGIGIQYISSYDHEKANVDLQRKLLEVEKATRKLETKGKEVETDLQKKQTAIKKTESELVLLEAKSKLTALHTQFGGPIVYANHPWNGTKLTPTSSVQATWKVAEIAASDQMRVLAYLNEVDRASLSEGAKVDVTVDALSGQKFAGVVKRIVQQAEAKEAWGSAAYFKVEVDFDNPQKVALVPGMSVLVEVL